MEVITYLCLFLSYLECSLPSKSVCYTKLNRSLEKALDAEVYQAEVLNRYNFAGGWIWKERERTAYEYLEICRENQRYWVYSYAYRANKVSVDEYRAISFGISKKVQYYIPHFDEWMADYIGILRNENKPIIK